MGNSDHVVYMLFQFLLTSLHHAAYNGDHLRDDHLRESSRDHLRDVPWDNIFKLGASATAAEFCD